MNKYKNDKKKFRIMLAVLLLGITLGYALLNANLTINGTSNFARTTWNIHFENLQDNTNMILGQNDSAAAITQNKTNEVTYAVSFNEPGQFYEFTVDAKNDGTIDGMINQVTSTIKIGNGEATPITTNPSNLPAYMSYSATYEDGTPIEQYHLLRANQKETYKVRVEFRTDIEVTDLPGENQTIELTFGVEYVQKDSNAVPVPRPSFGYVVSDTLMNIGSSIPQGVNVRSTPALAMADWDSITEDSGDTYPFYLKHKIANNLITESYIEFVVTPEMASENPGMIAGTYALRGGIDESNLEQGSQPIYEANMNTIRTAFGRTYCDNYDEPITDTCSVDGLGVEVFSEGSVIVRTDRQYCVTSYDCYIYDGSSSCVLSENC